MSERRPVPWDADNRPRGPTQDEDSERWPGAPEPTLDATGTVTNAVAWCRTCESDSTLCYRCSECGADLAAGGST